MKTTQKLFNYMADKSAELHRTEITKEMPLSDAFRVVILRTNLRKNLPEIKRILND
jgi:hypothetical protein